MIVNKNKSLFSSNLQKNLVTLRKSVLIMEDGARQSPDGGFIR